MKEMEWRIISEASAIIRVLKLTSQFRDVCLSLFEFEFLKGISKEYSNAGIPLLSLALFYFVVSWC